MSQPFLDISLRNSAATTCRLRGYPTIDVLAWSARGPAGAAPTVVRRGSIYEREDPGPHAVILTPSAFASFSLGTNTAQGKRLLTLTRLAITPPGSTQAVRLPVALFATRPPHRPVTIRVTAIHANPDAR